MPFPPLVSLVCRPIRSLDSWPSGMFQLPALQLYGGGGPSLQHETRAGGHLVSQIKDLLARGPVHCKKLGRPSVCALSSTPPVSVLHSVCFYQPQVLRSSLLWVTFICLLTLAKVLLHCIWWHSLATEATVKLCFQVSCK